MTQRSRRRLGQICGALGLGLGWAMLVEPAAAVAAQRVWSGLGGNTNWSTPGNWDGGVAPVAGDDLTFPATGTATANNDYPAGTTFGHLLFGATGLTITGNPISLSGGISMEGVLGSEVTLGVPIALTANQAWNSIPGSRVIMTQPIDLGPFTLDLSGWLRFNDVISGTGNLNLTFSSQPLEYELNAANTFSGTITTVAGTIYARNAAALGAGDGTPATGTVLNSVGLGFATLTLDGVTIANEHLTIGGSLKSITAPSALGGPVVLNGVVSTTVDAASHLTLSGPVSGPGTFQLSSGTLTLTHANNTFAAGMECINDGIVEVGAMNAIGTGRILFAPDCTLRLLDNVSQTVPTVSGEFALALGAGSQLILNGPTNGTYSGLATGSGAIRMQGTGTQSITGDASGFTGTLTVASGTVDMSSATPASMSVVDSGTLRVGSGALGPVSVTAGRIDVETTHPSSVASLVMHGTATFRIAAAPADTLTVAGDVDLTNGELDLVPQGPSPAVGTVFTLIDKGGSSPIVGTFLGQPEGAVVTVGNTSYRLSYVGGSGNDLTLTVVPLQYLYTLAEGASGGFFDTDILIANPSAQAVPIALSFFTDAGVKIDQTRDLPPLSRTTIPVDQIPGLEATTFSTTVTSETPIVVERTMRWDTRGYGAHTEKATNGTARTWYFAEGSQGFFSTFLLLTNPGPVASDATIEFLREGELPVTRTKTVAPESRLTFDLGTEPELVNRSFGITVNFSRPGVAERSMYFGTSPLWTGGHESAGVNAPAQTWFLAEGATGPFFETFVLLANPGDVDANVTLMYLPLDGVAVAKNRVVPARGRVTINLETEDPAFANTALATSVQSSQPILVERAQYWPDPFTSWYEAHNSFGVTELAQHWGLAEGRVGGPENYQTYILLANPHGTTANVQLVFLQENGAPVTKNVVVPPSTRTNVTVGPGTLVPEITNGRFGVDITSSETIVVERAMYSDAIGQVWAAGTNATGTRLPDPPQ